MFKKCLRYVVQDVGADGADSTVRPSKVKDALAQL